MKLTVLSNLDVAARSAAKARSGHGCVRCGCNIVVFCTLDGASPAPDIFLACPPCARILATMDDREEIAAAIVQHPVALQPEFDRRGLSYVGGMMLPDVRLPEGVMLRSTPIPIMFGGQALLEISTPEISGGPFVLNISLGAAGAAHQRVVYRNEWLGSDEWIFRRTGHYYTIDHHSGSARIAFHLLEDCEIAIDALQSHHGHRTLIIDDAGIHADGQRFMLSDRTADLVGLSI